MVNLIGLIMGVIALGFGVRAVIWPYKVAKISERWDAIGSKRRRSEIEPKEWKVKLTRLWGAVLIGIGVLLLLMSTNYV